MVDTHPGRVYGLSYVPSEGTGKHRKPPELVFTFSLEMWERISQINFEPDVIQGHARAYLGTDLDGSWILPEVDGQFGLTDCGRVLVSDLVRVSFRLTPESDGTVAFSIFVLLTLANQVLFEVWEEVGAESTQLVQVNTYCGHGFWGHGVGGMVHPGFGQWLRRKEDCSFLDVAAVLADAWIAFGEFENERERKEDLRDSGFFIAARVYDGRFLLTVPWNACEIAMYPDGDLSDTSCRGTFDSHNLDSARQQLSLLSGLAALCELADQEMDL